MMNKQNGRNSTNRKFIAVVIVMLIAIAAYIFIQYKETHISTDDAYITNDIFWVHPRIGGTLKAVFIKNNQYVKKDYIIAKIDSKPYQIKVHQAEAQVELYRAKLEQAQAAIDSIISQINLTKAKFNKAKWDFDRAKKLFISKTISKDKYEIYLTNYNVLKFDIEAKKSSLKEAQASLNSAKKALKVALTALSAAKLDLSYTNIKAPTSGFVTKKGVEIGSFVAPQTPLCALVPNKDAWIVANYKESQINKIKPGEEAEISIDAYPDLSWKGEVKSIQYGTGEAFSLFPPENAAGNWIKVTQRIPVKIMFIDKPKVPLRVGMSVKITILVK